jgi:hypothetical protein
MDRRLAIKAERLQAIVEENFGAIGDDLLQVQQAAAYPNVQSLNVQAIKR